MWKRANETDPTSGASPLDDWWKYTQNHFEPDSYQGSVVNASLEGPSFKPSDNANCDDEVSKGTWSEESDESDGSISDNEDI